MRRIYRNKHLAIAVVLITMLLVLTLGVTPSSAADWTFMVYLDGDNDLEIYAVNDFLEMAAVGSDSNVNIVVQFDRIHCPDPYYDDTRYDDWTTTKRYLITAGMVPNNANALMDIGEVDMADPTVLADFVEWAIQNYPADNYALILWNHGSGWYKGISRLHGFHGKMIMSQVEGEKKNRFIKGLSGMIPQEIIFRYKNSNKP